MRGAPSSREREGPVQGPVLPSQRKNRGPGWAGQSAACDHRPSPAPALQENPSSCRPASQARPGAMRRATGSSRPTAGRRTAWALAATVAGRPLLGRPPRPGRCSQVRLLRGGGPAGWLPPALFCCCKRAARAAQAGAAGEPQPPGTRAPPRPALPRCRRRCVPSSAPPPRTLAPSRRRVGLPGLLRPQRPVHGPLRALPGAQADGYPALRRAAARRRRRRHAGRRAAQPRGEAGRLGVPRPQLRQHQLPGGCKQAREGGGAAPGLAMREGSLRAGWWDAALGAGPGMALRPGPALPRVVHPPPPNQRRLAPTHHSSSPRLVSIVLRRLQWRTECHKCNTPRPESAQVLGPQAGGRLQPGDWICSDPGRPSPLALLSQSRPSTSCSSHCMILGCTCSSICVKGGARPAPRPRLSPSTPPARPAARPPCRVRQHQLWVPHGVQQVRQGAAGGRAGAWGILGAGGFWQEGRGSSMAWRERRERASEGRCGEPDESWSGLRRRHAAALD